MIATGVILELANNHWEKPCLLTCISIPSLTKRLKVEWWLPRAGGGGNGELLLIGYGVSVWENVLEMLATVAHKVSVLNVSEMYTY